MLVGGFTANAQYLTHPDLGKQKKPERDTQPIITTPTINWDSINSVLQERARIEDSIANANRRPRRRYIATTDTADTIIGRWALPVDSSNLQVDSDNGSDTLALNNIPGIVGNERNRSQQNWVFFIAVLLMGLITLSRYINPKNLALSLKSVFNWGTYHQLLSENRQLFFGANIRYFIFSNAVFAMLITIMLDLLNFDILGNDYRLFLLVFLGVTVVFVFKYVIHLLLADMLEMEQFGVSNVQYGLLYTFLQGLIMLPLILLTYYNKGTLISETNLLNIYLYMFLGLLIVRILLNLLLNRSYFPFSIFYLFVYLCVLEILPVFVGVKAVLDITT